MTERIEEYTDSRGVAVHVDRRAGVLKGVKLIGLTSRNGRRYREAALAQAAALYEEAKVNVNHSKAGPRAPRDYQDRLGVMRNVTFRTGDGLYGNLHFNPRHTLAEQLLWDAKHNPRNVGFSHNVEARLVREGAQTVVEEITHVHSVDLVADPAATEGLFEQTGATTAGGCDASSELGSVMVAWEELTLEALRRERPDLWDALRETAGAEQAERLDTATAEVARLQRTAQVHELLARHGLALEQGTPRHNAETPILGTVGPAFFEMLVGAAVDHDVEKLITERAEQLRSNARAGGLGWNSGVPRSREQSGGVGAPALSIENAQDFARVIKS